MNENLVLSKQQVDDLAEIIRTLYLEDEIPWIVGYSGGKDSTAALQMVWYAVSKLPKEKRSHKKIYVLTTDTLIESPVVAEWIKRSLRNMRKAAGEQDMPVEAHLLIPSYNDTFWVNLIGRGYPAPRMRTNFRWCTDRLKIKPTVKFTHEVIDVYGRVVIVLGTRKAESANRARTIKKHEKGSIKEYYYENPNMLNSYIFAPIQEWSNEHVWQFLLNYKNPWGHSNEDLLTMYKGATEGGECPLVLDTDTPSCGNSRFGCWMCTVVEKDKSMEAMIQNDEEKEWMIPLLEFRNEVGDIDKDWERRDFRRINGSLTYANNKLIHGPYKKEWREYWLRRLLQLQKEINQNGPKGFKDLKLIQDEELREIRRIWLTEKHEFCDTLPQIYREVTNERFPYENEFPQGSFGQEEWDELQSICKEMYPEEELLMDLQASLLDVEKRSVMMNLRRGILNKLEDQIKRCYYKNEADAEAYAVAKKEIQDMSIDNVHELDVLREDIYETY